MKVEQHEEGTDETLAVGFIATDANLASLPWDVVRALERGFAAYVTYDPSVATDRLRVVEELGATVVDPRVDTDRIDPYRSLTEAAEEQTLTRVYHPEPAEMELVDAAAADAVSPDRAGDADVVGSGPDGIESNDAVERASTVVAIPAYNEGRTITEVVAAADEHVDEVLVVDDGSSDDTAERAREAGATVVEHATNRGYGGAVRTAFREARDRGVDRLVTLDADGQHDPADLPKVLRTLDETGADLAIGSRFVSGGSTNAPLYRLFGLKTVNALTNLSMGVLRRRSWISDTQSGFRAYGSRAIESLGSDPGIGENMSASIDILYHMHHNDYRIVETGVAVDYDVEEASSHNPVSHGLSLVSNILKTVERERPLTALGLPGFVGSFVGLTIAYITMSTFLTTGVFRVGLAVTATFFTLTGLFTCFTAVILHSVSHVFEESRRRAAVDD